MIVRWTAPDDGGSVITAYTIMIRQNDGGFSPVLTTCNGASATIVQNLQCSISETVLIAAPFNIPWNSEVFATVAAVNIYGTSGPSTVGGGAIIVTVPNPPLNLQNNSSLTTSTQIGFTWSEPSFDGGKPVISYRINIDRGTGVYELL